MAPQYVLPDPAPPSSAPGKVFALFPDPVDENGKTVSTAVAAERLVTLLEDVRSVPVDGSVEGGVEASQVVPLGVVVSANVRVEGLAGERLGVYWRISRISDANLPFRNYFTDLPALQIRAERHVDGGNVQFWVPMPVASGEYEVEVSIRDERGQRLVAETTEAFR